MSYIFMKILERRPASYDAGITRYGLGYFAAVRDRMLSLVKPGDRVLDVGCGPGTFSVECAKRGAVVEAVDVNPQMLYTADLAAKKAGVVDKVTFSRASATNLEFDKAAFDIIVFSLSMSELREVEQWAAMNLAFDLLKPGGALVVADEVVPTHFASRLRYSLRRLVLMLITYVVTRATTHPVREMTSMFRACGFSIAREEEFEGGSLKLVVGSRMEQRPTPTALSPFRLPAWLEALGVVFSYFTLAFRDVPMRPGVYAVGDPRPDSPVMVTANYLLTFTSVRKHLRGLDCYLLVIDSRGINVWCAAGKGSFSAEEIRNGLLATRLGDMVTTRRLILPKLSANGVRYRDVKKLTGWEAEFGPVYARDLTEYARNGFALGEHMKRVDFGLAERMRVAPPFALFIAFWFALPLVFFHHLYSAMVPGVALAAGLVFPAVFNILPSDRFFKKGLTLGLVGAAMGVIFLMITGAPAKEMAQWALIIIGMTLFVAMDFSGMSAVSNYSKIKEEYYVVAPLLGLVILSYIAISLLWR
jgi:ubiquinone/menaquinone biosynthesis C-methylase UbiE